MFVAPYMGAWIETFLNLHQDCEYVVAPYMGAWIETGLNQSTDLTKVLSHPIWVRGLKPISLWTRT